MQPYISVNSGVGRWFSQPNAQGTYIHAATEEHATPLDVLSLFCGAAHGFPTTCDDTSIVSTKRAIECLSVQGNSRTPKESVISASACHALWVQTDSESRTSVKKDEVERKVSSMGLREGLSIQAAGLAMPNAGGKVFRMPKPSQPPEKTKEGRIHGDRSIDNSGYLVERMFPVTIVVEAFVSRVSESVSSTHSTLVFAPQKRKDAELITVFQLEFRVFSTERHMKLAVKTGHGNKPRARNAKSGGILLGPTWI
ncbi:uncharacterized protein ARMOST_11598 [Armillaria ostoyae]|uniref:Uncharacterized protein n=1 Tax=Armillaria ostoyae TaxID=47428 RepID=A0A284RHK3_ARMOS|nr:uncharacterized protein ARMOST_11598 [Armillaria ostoyae]